MNSAISERKAFYTKLVGIALPVVFQGLLNNSLSFVDTVMIGQLGEASIAAVALANQMFFLISLLYFGLLRCIDLPSPSSGAGNRTNIQKVLGLSVLVAGIAALVMPSPHCSSLHRSYGSSLTTTPWCCVALNTCASLPSATSSAPSPRFWPPPSRHRARQDTVESRPLRSDLQCGRELLLDLRHRPSRMGSGGAALSTALSRLLEMVVLIIIV